MTKIYLGHDQRNEINYKVKVYSSLNLFSTFISLFKVIREIGKKGQ